MFGYMSLAILAAFLLYGLMNGIRLAITALVFHGASLGQAFPYGTSVVRDQQTRKCGLVVEEPEIKALFANILDCADRRLPAGGAPSIDIQYRCLFVPQNHPRFKALPMGEWVATLVEKSRSSQDIRTEYCDEHELMKGSTTVGALEGLLQKLKDK